MLFIGESPPASGRFFYRRDSGLYRAIRDAFLTIDRSITDETFLETFRHLGCYLIDLCPDPVDALDPRPRRTACLARESVLTRQLQQLQPAAIVTLVKSIRDNVRRAVDRAGWHGLALELPYPGRWAGHRRVFLEGLVPHLQQLFRNRPTIR